MSTKSKVKFLQDIQRECLSIDRDTSIDFVEMLVRSHVLLDYIAKITGEIERCYSAKDKQDNCEEEKEQIATYYQQRIVLLEERRRILNLIKDFVWRMHVGDMTNDVDYILEGAIVKNGH